MYKYLLKLGSFVYNVFAKRNRKSWHNIKSEVKTHYDVYDVLNGGNFEYSKKNDRLFDNIQRPDVFVATGKGDCDDFANFANELLRFIGYNSRLVGMWKSPTEGHAICAFEYIGYWFYFSNKNIVGRFKSFDECIEHFYGAETMRYEVIK